MDERWMGCATPGYRLKTRSWKLGPWRPWWVREGSQKWKDEPEGITRQQEKASVRKDYTSQGQEGLDSCRSMWCTRWLRYLPGPPSVGE